MDWTDDLKSSCYINGLGLLENACHLYGTTTLTSRGCSVWTMSLHTKTAGSAVEIRMQSIRGIYPRYSLRVTPRFALS